MKKAYNFRVEARRALSGHWTLAVAVGLVATLLSGGVGVVNTGSSAEGSGYLSMVGHDAWITMLTISVVSVIVALCIGGCMQMGWSKFHLKLQRNQQAKFGDLFSCFDRFGTGLCMALLMGLFVFLWSLLLIVPGIIAFYRYAMTPWILADHPEMGAREAIRESGRIMRGNKWRLFCLQMSFFGWALLSAVTLGIGTLWLTPYMQSAYAAFYEEISQTRPLEEPLRGPELW